jgi:hypothetical protein
MPHEHVLCSAYRSIVGIRHGHSTAGGKTSPLVCEQSELESHMRRTFWTVAGLLLMLLVPGPIQARLELATPVYEHEYESPKKAPRSGCESYPVFRDDMEGDVSGYVSVDLTVGYVPHFHVSSYMA